MHDDVIFLVGLSITAGGAVQSTVGLGLGLVAAPIVTLIDPGLMPGVMLIAGLLMSIAVAAREWRYTLWQGAYWVTGGCAAGTLAGLSIVSVFPARALGAAVGVMVLAAIGVTAVHAQLPRNRWTLMAAGIISGTAATATSLGGPPIALLYQNESGPMLRSTLGAYFCIGNGLALASLAASGHLPGQVVLTSLALSPFAIAGFVLSAPLRRYLDSGRTRAALLSVVGISAAVLLAHTLMSYA